MIGRFKGFVGEQPIGWLEKHEAELNELLAEREQLAKKIATKRREIACFKRRLRKSQA